MKNIRELSFHRKLNKNIVTSCSEHLDTIPYQYRKDCMDLILWDKIDMLKDAIAKEELESGTEFITQDLFAAEEWDLLRVFPGKTAIETRLNYILNNNNLPFEKINSDWPSIFKII